MLRRISGGAAVVVGPGCLMYALVLSLRLRPQLRNIDQAHAQMLGTIAAALRQAPVVPPLGGSAVTPLKGGSEPGGLSQGPFRLKPVATRAGNRALWHVRPGDWRQESVGQQRPLPRDYLLYHGTLLYDFPLQQIGRLLAMPPRQPDYRQARAHDMFVTNLPLGADSLRLPCAPRGEPTMVVSMAPSRETARLVAEKYSRREWNEQL